MVQQYENAMTKSSDMVKDAKKALANFCKEGVKELIERGYDSDRSLGWDTSFAYRLSKGKTYRGPEQTEVNVDDVPFPNFNIRQLKALAKFIEEERARYLIPVTPQ